MLLPTIVSAGADGGLLLITDHNGAVHRIPKASLVNVFDSSNGHVKRLDIVHARGEINLQFADEAKVAAALAAIDALY